MGRMDGWLLLGALAAIVATVLLVWGFRAVVHRARGEGRSVPALVIASVLFSPFLVLLALRRRR